MDAVVSSPPYAAGCGHTGGETRLTSGQGGLIRLVEYGESEGQLAGMREGEAAGGTGGGEWVERDWHGLYREGWGEEIVREAYAHPAKFARGLLRRIYDHLVEEGYLVPGMTVLDPFAGVALGALDCKRVGCDWLGVELEEKFVGLGNENLARWEGRYLEMFPGWGRAALVQGDSREIGQVVRREMGAVVSSPPYEAGRGRDSNGIDAEKLGPHGRYSQAVAMADYGGADGQLGQEAGETFWGAARQVVEGCAELLAPGGVAVWVVKRFVRDGEVVPFPDQWRRMCEAAGFVMVEWIRAWVVEENGVQVDLWGNGHVQRKERKSFFRRLYEKRWPENAIDWEDVLIMRRV